MDLIPAETRRIWDEAWAAMSPEEREELAQLKARAREDLDALTKFMERWTAIRSAALTKS